MRDRPRGLDIVGVFVRVPRAQVASSRLGSAALMTYFSHVCLDVCLHVYYVYSLYAWMDVYVNVYMCVCVFAFPLFCAGGFDREAV